MSRSTKKSGWAMDGASRSSSGVHFAKRKANKAVRRFDDAIPTKGKFFRKITNPYDIHDIVYEARTNGSDMTAYRDWMK